MQTFPLTTNSRCRARAREGPTALGGLCPLGRAVGGGGQGHPVEVHAQAGHDQGHQAPHLRLQGLAQPAQQVAGPRAHPLGCNAHTPDTQQWVRLRMCWQTTQAALLLEGEHVIESCAC